MIRIRDVKFNNSLFYSLEDIDLDHFLYKKIKQTIKILNI